MSTTTAISANAVHNNGAVVLFGGAASTTGLNPNVTSVPFLSVVGPSPDVVMGSGIHAGAAECKNAPYNAMRAGEYQMIRHSTKIAGATNTTLLTGGRDFAQNRSINLNESNYTLHAVSSSWNYVTGQFLSTSGIVPVTNDSFGTDDAARPTRSAPGEFVYHEGKGSGPTQADYSAKTGG